ncbi:MAG: hypothetical protein H0V30_06560 [Chitinophagaceae bacterium]|jgi:hypothetical protein|nr:hypothetical protein [Chitinophagaceae bacterium]
MKIIMLAGLLLYSCISFAGIPSLTEVRALYQKAAKEEKICNKLIGWLSPYNEKNNPLLFGYKAGGTMMMANYVFNPISKFSYFNKGKKMLDKAISADGKNVELRFIRLTIQTNIPSFLGYKNHIGSDKTFLLQTLPHLKDYHLRNMIVSYFKQQGYLPETY